MPPRPGNLNPDSRAGNARLGRGSGSNAGRSQPSGARNAVVAPKKFKPPVGSVKAPDAFIKSYQTRAQRKANPTYMKATSTTAKKQLGKYYSVDKGYERYLDSFAGPRKMPKDYWGK
jgi:hypothetical protein